MCIEHTHRQNQLKKYQHQHHARCSHYQQSIRMMLVSSTSHQYIVGIFNTQPESSEHGDGLDDIDAVISVVHIDVQIIAEMAKGI